MKIIKLLETKAKIKEEKFWGKNLRLNEAILLPFLVGAPQGIVPELLFEKKELIPAIQELIIEKC